MFRYWKGKETTTRKFKVGDLVFYDKPTTKAKLISLKGNPPPKLTCR